MCKWQKAQVQKTSCIRYLEIREGRRRHLKERMVLGGPPCWAAEKAKGRRTEAVEDEVHLMRQHTDCPEARRAAAEQQREKKPT